MLLLGGACAWWVIALFWLTLAPSRNHPAVALACGLLVLVPAFIALARLLAATRGLARGPQLVLWLVLMVVAADVGAYFAGRGLGRRKLAPRVSPGKTLEGALGGLVMVALVAWGGALYFGLPQPAVVAFGCAVGIFSVIGDLTESMVKRAAGLKDSGALLPGHGGLLDRIDSVTAAAPPYALGLFGSGVIA
jgi:phosphatidate cytidylyltransferase